jgi:hypothetical protein
VRWRAADEHGAITSFELYCCGRKPAI